MRQRRGGRPSAALCRGLHVEADGMTPIAGADEQVAAWVAAHIPGCERGFGACSAMGIVDETGKLVAGVVFHDWSPERGTIELSAASTSRRWMTRRVVSAVFEYAFTVARMAVTRTSEKNAPVRRIWRALGASEYVIPDLWAKGEAGVFFTLTPDQLGKSRFGNGQVNP